MVCLCVSITCTYRYLEEGWVVGLQALEGQGELMTPEGLAALQPQLRKEGKIFSALLSECCSNRAT